ncbi:MAG: 2,3-bisphosphoglycerate-independent phosphoglycerate mutase [Bernardetiaceae bacterium]
MKTLLMILDGWGIGPDPEVSAIAQAHTPFIDHLLDTYPHTTLRTDGLFVGLPEGQMGNSEVGHTHLGAGRIVYQNLVRIQRAIDTGELSQNAVLQDAFERAKAGAKLHLIGLVSDGGVHAQLTHLEALCRLAADAGIPEFFVHAFTDGRDTAPQSGIGYLTQLQKTLEATGGQLATVVGRYYAMDRDQRWERIQIAHQALTQGIGTLSQDPLLALQHSYDQGITDEFVQPIITADTPRIQSGDVVICFNFRTDRCRQLTQALAREVVGQMQPLDLHYLTMTRYDATFTDIPVLFEDQDLSDTMGEVLAKHQKTQLRIAETEKYPHVTFFFSGGRETPFAGEERLMCNSPKVATYDLQPEMSAFELRDSLLDYWDRHTPDFVCLNFANADMVGHTGVMSAAVAACQAVDTCAEAVIERALQKGYTILVLADHGNADCMRTPEGKPHTAHTTNPVPCILVQPTPTYTHLRSGKLGDVAPTLLHLMGLPIPAAMDGEVLVE